MPVKYSVRDRQRAKAMREAGADFHEIAKAIGDLTYMEAYHLVAAPLPKKEPSPLIRLLASLGEGTVVPPAYLINEAMKREIAPRTVTMRLCGDPVLNQCAWFVTQYGERL